MSAKAVTARIKRVSQLRRLCLSLGGTKPVKIEGTEPHSCIDNFDSGESIKANQGESVGQSQIPIE